MDDTYRIITKLNDGRSEAPPIIEQGDRFDVADTVCEELANDNGVTLPVGATILIERIA